MKMHHPANRSDSKEAIRPSFKRVIPVLLLLSMTLPIGVTAQEPSAGKSAQDTSMDDLLSDMGPAAQDEATAPAQSPATPAAQEAPAAATAETPAASSPSAEADQPPPAAPEQPAAAELDVIPVPQPAKAPPKGRQIEEVVVTAQKREQVSQEVPISMSVLSETFIKDQGITNVADALLFVPNFRVVEYAGRVSPQCRGFTVSEGNPAFESPCGIALDGIAFSRGAYFSAGLLDLKRIEVLRGPQGTTFGKNTTAGVISLVSKDPTDEFTANADLQYGLSGPGTRRAEVGVGGPLIPGVVNFRLAGQRELRDGYMENTYHRIDPSVPEEVGNSKRSAYRAKLTFQDVFGAELKLLHEHTDLFSNGFPTKVIPLNQAWADYITQYDPNADFGENYKTSNLGNQVWTETTRNQAELNFDWADWSFTGVGGFGELINRQAVSAFPAPIPVAYSKRGEESPYITGEVRAVSPNFEGLLGLKNLFGLDLGSSNLLVGVFGQQQELKKLTIDADVVYSGVGILVLASENVSLPLGTVFDLLGRQFGANPSESFHIKYNQTTQSTAIFSQLTWNMTEKWSVDLGARVSQETKDAHWDVSYSQPAPLLNTTGDRGYVKDKSLVSNSVQPKVSLTYRLNDDINLFAHWARAFKSGGFNAYTSTGDPERPNATNPNATTGSLAYGDETGTDWGFDAKMRLFDNQMQLNLSLFRLDVANFQVLTEVLGSETTPGGPHLPNGYQQVVNAGEARAQGVEIDQTWLATDWLTVINAIGYNDTKYLSFPLDNCGPQETANPANGKCDHSGKEFLGTPKLTGTLTLDTRFPLAGLWSALGDTQFLLGGTIEYTGAQYSGNYSPESRQDSHFRYRANTGFSNPSQGWSFRVTALNLTNEYLGTKTTDTSVHLSSISPTPPRSIFAQFSWNY